ncbi:MAG: DUF192 domain-containing protein [Minisyncoccota bacterium]
MATMTYRRVLRANMLLVLVLIGLGVLGNHFYPKIVPVDHPDRRVTAAVATTTVATVTINGVAIKAEIADAPATREQGLSGRGGLAKNHGMLFLFDHLDRYTFWMKDMRFALDLVWIGADGRIVDITPEVLPSSYPATFSPKSPVAVVLEVPAGTAKREIFSIGDVVNIFISRNP